MRGGARRPVAFGLLLGCGPGPSEVTAPLDGTTGPSTSTASTGMASTPGSSSMEASTADGSGGATGQGAAASSDGGTTQGVLAETSTGEVASTGLAGTSSGGESSSSTGAPPSCDDLYGMAPDYELCMETPDQCHFAATTAGDDCNAMCSLFGGACIDAFDNSTGCAIIRPDMDTCDTNRGSEICVCSR